VDITSAAQLTALIGGLLNAGAVHLTIDASELSYLDSMSIQVLVVVAKILRARGGGLVLLRPQRPVARMLTLMGAGQVITIQRAIQAAPEPGSDAELARAAGSDNPLCACHVRAMTTPEEQTVEVAARAAAVAVKGRSLSQFSHGLTGRYRTMASMPDTGRDADLRIRIPAHWVDTIH
jgi:anti-sigma B factor antagonist